MADVTPLPGTRLLNTPERPPRAWFTDDSPDFVPGQSLQVVIDGPDEGRVFGLIQPPPHGSAYSPGVTGRQHRHYGRRPPDARMYPDRMATFNRGPVAVANPDGSPGRINGGKLTIRGDHSMDAVGAANLDQALDWLHREGRYAHLADDVGIVGVASPCTLPGFEGAVMFRGAALPGMNVREALVLNATSYSAEVWPSAAHDGQLVFAGAVQCEHTAWPWSQPESLAAAADGGCVGPFCVIYDDGCVECGDVEDGDDMVPVAAAAAQQLIPDVPAGVTELTPAQQITNEPPDPTLPAAPAPQAQVVIAPPAGLPPEAVAELEEIKQNLEDLAEQVNTIAVTVAELAIHVYGGENSGALNEVEGLSNRMAQLEALIEQVMARESTPMPQNEADGYGTATV